MKQKISIINRTLNPKSIIKQDEQIMHDKNKIIKSSKSSLNKACSAHLQSLNRLINYKNKITISAINDTR